MSTMAIHARWEFDLRIGTGKESSREAATEETPLKTVALPVAEATRRRWFGRALLSFATPSGVELLKWALRLHGFPV
jgi:hypothetical protein